MTGPTGGWGSIEYAIAAWTPGQVLGGRWKPLHYWYRKSLFTKVFATCGAGQCMVKNDHFEALSGAALSVSKVSLATGEVTSVYSNPTLQIAAGPGAALFFPIDASIDATAYVLRATVTNASSGLALTDNWVPLLPPTNWTSLGRATVSFTVADAPASDGSFAITLTSDKLAAYVTLTTLAQGRFSDNAFFLLPGTATVSFIPWAEAQGPLLQESLRIEHVASY
jgi:beta-mannosidase